MPDGKNVVSISQDVQHKYPEMRELYDRFHAAIDEVCRSEKEVPIIITLGVLDMVKDDILTESRGG